MNTNTRAYDVSNYLRTPEEVAVYLDACIQEADGEAAFIAKALGDIVRAQGMTKVSRDVRFSMEILCKALVW
jgi:probable addiction module antidote protein